jgi:hypothetical protein
MKLKHLLAIHPGLSAGVLLGLSVVACSFLGSILVGVGQAFR